MRAASDLVGLVERLACSRGGSVVVGDQRDGHWIAARGPAPGRADGLVLVVAGVAPTAPPVWDQRRQHPRERAETGVDLAQIVEERAGHLRPRWRQEDHETTGDLDG